MPGFMLGAIWANAAGAAASRKAAARDQREKRGVKIEKFLSRPRRADAGRTVSIKVRDNSMLQQNAAAVKGRGAAKQGRHGDLPLLDH